MRKTGYVLMAVLGLCPAAAAQSKVEFALKPSSVQIRLAGKAIADYVMNDPDIKRPFFAHVRAPSGLQVTRSHPPVAGKDETDHATMHPGIWLAFGDLSGADFWRNRGTVKHQGMIDKPAGGAGAGSFTVKNHYEASGKTLAVEICKISFSERPGGYLLSLASTFTSPADFSFGDQEEMGLGVRVATSMTVKRGGQIVNREGLKNEKQVWGKQADWCCYSGTVDGKPVGVVVMPHAQNFRRSWFHARDYGLLVANPFGQRAFTKGEASKIVVRAGDSLRLRFGVLVYDGQVDGQAEYVEYLKTAGQ